MRAFRGGFVALVLACGASSALAQAPTATPRAPTAKWTLNFGDNACHAARDYGSKTAPLALAIKPSPLGDLYEVIIVSEVPGSRFARETSASVRVGVDAPFDVKLLTYKLKDDDRTLTRFRLPQGAAAGLRKARSLTVNARGATDYAFALDGTGALMTQMERCLASLQDHWNITPTKQASLKTRATANLAKAFSDADYPKESIRRNQEGRVAVTLLVDETGKVADCTLTETSGAALLDVQTCIRIQLRGKFKPAVGADGKPARDSATGRISWRMRS